MPTNAKTRIARTCAAWLALLWCGLAAQAASVAVDQPMKTAPTIAAPEPVTVWPAGMAELWRQALDRPEADLHIDAAGAIAQAAPQGMPGLDAAAPRLTALLNDAQQPLPVRTAAAQALIALNNPQAAPALAGANRQGATAMILATDSALARWDAAGMTPAWLERVADISLPQVVRASAAQALPDALAAAQVRELLSVIVDEQTPWAVRLAAADAVGRQHERAGVLEAVRSLSSRKPAVYWRMAQAAMLSATDASERGILQQFAMESGGPGQPDAVTAMQKLNAASDWTIEPGKLTTELMRNRDAKVRGGLIVALNKRGDAAAVALLAKLLNDADPANRTAASDAILTLVQQQATLRDPAIAGGMLQLNSDDWRGQEQAALLLGSLGHKPAAARMVELLQSPRHEVRLASLVGLRRLEAVDKMPAVLALAQREAAAMKAGSPDADTRQAFASELSQAFQAFGVLDFKNADARALMMTFIPKNAPFGVEAREAAIWSLGMLSAGTGDSGLIEKLAGRVNDMDSMNPEADMVRIASAVAIGRIKPASVPGVISRYAAAPQYGEEAAIACRWAIEQITGQPQPPLEPTSRKMMQWFLVPLEK